MRQLQAPVWAVDQKVKTYTKGERKGEWRDWDDNYDGVKEFKSNFLSNMLMLQDKRCAVCSLKIDAASARRKRTIDHFVPKGRYPRWTFEILNLVICCSVCNEHFKSEFDPLPNPYWPNLNVPYAIQNFSIIHPYIDLVSEHIGGGYDVSSVFPKLIYSKSFKGDGTIRLFNLDRYGLWLEWVSDYKREKLKRDTLSSVLNAKRIASSVSRTYRVKGGTQDNRK